MTFNQRYIIIICYIQHEKAIERFLNLKVALCTAEDK